MGAVKQDNVNKELSQFSSTDKNNLKKQTDSMME